tara:strand:+ start:29314 stop:29841 length:528 start_codon:yes stop_codon:yes gene_type:complete
MKRIGNLAPGEAAIIDARAVCRDPNWQIRVSIFYDAYPITPLRTGITLAYLEKIQRGPNKTVLKLFYPKIASMKDIPMWEWPAVHEACACPVAIVNFLEPTLYRSLHEAMPEFPCRICGLREQDKYDICEPCNRILSHYMGICINSYPKIHKMKLREQLVKRLAKVKMDEYPKNS